jgi:hypothetical protein
MLITFKKHHDRLIPADEDSVKFFNNLKIGEEFSCDYKIKKQRSYQYHKFYFAMLKAVLNNQSHYKTIENLHEAVKVRSGYYETIIPFKGEPFIIAKSLSFEKMDSLQFDEFMKEAKTVAMELVGDDALEEILRFI